jgi:hypothetical protein
VSNQFEYSWRLTEDSSAGLYFAAFRYSFCVVAFAVKDTSDAAQKVSKFSPVEVSDMLRAL